MYGDLKKSSFMVTRYIYMYFSHKGEIGDYSMCNMLGTLCISLQNIKDKWLTVLFWLPKTLTLTLSLNWYKVKVSKVFSHICKSIFVQGQITSTSKFNDALAPLINSTVHGNTL